MEKSKRNKLIINLIIVVVITALAVVYLTRAKIITKESLSLIPWYAFIIVLVCFFLSQALFSFYEWFVYKSFTDKMPYYRCLGNSLCGNLGSNVTPFRLGHFPIMAYYQFGKGVPLVDTITGFVKSQIIMSITSIIVYTVIVTVLGVRGVTINFNGTTVALWWVVSLGLLFHALVFGANIILAFNLPLQKWVVKTIARIIHKFKKSFNVEEFIEKRSEKLLIFKEQIQIVGKGFYKYLIPVLLYILYMLFSSSFQYISYLLVSKTAFTLNGFLTFYVLFLASQYITNIVPIPGGAGASELIFTLMFKTVIEETFMGATLCLWRASTYYFVIIIETVLFIILTFTKSKNSAVKTEITAEE